MSFTLHSICLVGLNLLLRLSLTFCSLANKHLICTRPCVFGPSSSSFVYSHLYSELAAARVLLICATQSTGENTCEIFLAARHKNKLERRLQREGVCDAPLLCNLSDIDGSCAPF